MSSRKMYRKTTCLGCGYVQEDSVSYYLHAKAWKAGHDVKACLELRKMSEVSAKLELEKKG